MQAILLNPGPVTLSESVRQAAVRVDLCHREPEFFQLLHVRIKGRPALLREFGVASAPPARVGVGIGIGRAAEAQHDADDRLAAACVLRREDLQGVSRLWAVLGSEGRFLA